MLRKLFKDITVCLKRYICESFDSLITSLIKQYVVKKKYNVNFTPIITIFLVILRQYRYIWSLNVVITRYNNLIPLFPFLYRYILYRGSTVVSHVVYEHSN